MNSIGGEANTAAVNALRSSLSAVAALPVATMSNPERVELLQDLETVARMIPAIGHDVLNHLCREADPTEFGGARMKDVLADALRIDPPEAGRRIREAEQLGERVAINGEPLEPVHPNTAAAQKAGLIGREHTKTIGDFFHHLPVSVDDGTRMQAEAQLADLATGIRPDMLKQCADRLAAHLNPDGEFQDLDRERKRSLHLGKQGSDKMSKLSGLLDPELRAYLEAVFAKFAKPGMCNPDDAAPVVDGDPSDDVARRDPRTAGQRQHDALKAVCRSALSSDLGQHRGLPVTVIVSTTLKDLEQAAGCAVTGGGSLLPIRDLIRMASHAHHYLSIFDDDGRPIYLGRSKRIASADQRIVLHARDRGCTFPGCSMPGYLCQTHHVDEWADGGDTDATNLTFACDAHHSLVGTQWQTYMKSGRTHWIPAKHADPRQRPRINRYHHPGEHLVDDHGGGEPRSP